MKNSWGHEYSVALMIRGAELDPEAITDLLKLQPTQTWRKGEKRTFRPAKVSGWEFKVHPSGADREFADLENGLNAALDVLEPVADKVQELATRFDVVWWIGHHQSCFDGGPSFSPKLLQRLAEFGIELGVDNYFHGQDRISRMLQSVGNKKRSTKRNAIKKRKA